MRRFSDKCWVNVRGCAYFLIGFIAWIFGYADLLLAAFVASIVGSIDAGLSTIARWDGQD